MDAGMATTTVEEVEAEEENINYKNCPLQIVL